MVRFGHRDYDPDIGNCAARDPIFLAGGDTDLYGYCLNDLVNLNDPLGLWPAPKENFSMPQASAYFHAGGRLLNVEIPWSEYARGIMEWGRSMSVCVNLTSLQPGCHIGNQEVVENRASI